MKRQPTRSLRHPHAQRRRNLRRSRRGGSQVDRLLAALLAVRQQALSGTLEASRGGSSLGLTRGVADWIDSLDAPILKAVAEVERIYRRQAGS